MALSKEDVTKLVEKKADEYRQQRIRGNTASTFRDNGNVDKEYDNTSNGLNETGRGIASEGRGTSYRDVRHFENNTIDNGSFTGWASPSYVSNGRFTADNLGVDIGQRRFTDDTDTATGEDYEQPTIVEPTPLRKSKFNLFGKVGDVGNRYREAYQRSQREKQQREKISGQAKTGTKRRVLSETEIKNTRSDLIESILWQSDHADQLIIATTKGHDKSIIIWSDIDRDDASILADFLLERGRRDPYTAEIVRGMLDIQRKVQVGLILIPRAVATLSIYLQRGIGIALY